MPITQAVILAGGFGTRMREESEFKPKPMVQVGERPILEHIAYNFAKQGVENILVLLGYKGEVIRDHFLNYREHTQPFKIDLQTGDVQILGNSPFPKCQITFLDTGLHSLTGERLLRATPYLEDEFFLTYGDGLADVDLLELEKTHRNANTMVTVTVTPNTSKFGVVSRNESGQVLSFSEKPDGHDLINMGYFLINKASLEFLPPKTMLEVEFLHNLISRGELNSYKHDGFFAAIDTPRDLDAVNLKYREGSLQWLI
jgi:glucose-1-phosphate cytidylyltransferase